MCSAKYFSQFILVVIGLSEYDRSSIIQVSVISFTTVLGTQGNAEDCIHVLSP